MPSDDSIRAMIEGLVHEIAPFDALEHQHCAQTLAWIASDAPLFRIAKPSTPPMHLVSYCVVIDPAAAQILLCDHKNAQLWLPCGGHVEPNEHPLTTVHREVQEELGIEAILWQTIPLFLTVTTTVGHDAGHTDVSLWYVVLGSTSMPLQIDPNEAHDVQWFDFDALPAQTDPHLSRFVAKLKTALGSGFL